MLKGQKGITLVALVITIIVLIILAGVSISLVLSDNGLMNRAQEGAKNYQEAANAEQTQLNAVPDQINQIMANIGI